METYKDYNIAGIRFRIAGEELLAGVARIEGFKTFEAEAMPAVPEFTFEWKENGPGEGEVLYTAYAEGVTNTFRRTDRGYHVTLVHDNGKVLEIDKPGHRDGDKVFFHGDRSVQLLRFGLWVAFGMMTAHRHRIAIHSSCIVNNGVAYLFLGESGTGKSTHTRLWRENIPGSVLLNDDSPIIVAENGSVEIYGSPWSGKTPCYKQEHYPLGGCVRLSQAPYNKMEKLPLLRAYGSLHPSTPPEFAYDNDLYDGISSTLDKVLTSVPIWHLDCLPDADAAKLSFKNLTSGCWLCR